MDGTILITGATGTVGSATLSMLRQRGAPVKALVYDLSRAMPLLEQGCRVMVHDLARPLPAEAMDGVAAVLAITPAGPDAVVQASHIIQAAAQAELPVVRVSTLNAAPDAPTQIARAHHRSEQELQAAGIPYTILRPHHYLQNILAAMPDIQGDGRIKHAMGGARLAMVDARDVAACASEILLRGRHRGKTYTTTGPTAITWGDVAKTVSRAIGSRVIHVPLGAAEYWHECLDQGMSEWAAQSALDHGKAFQDGWGDVVTDDVRTITGKAPRSLSQFCEEQLAPLVQTAV